MIVKPCTHACARRPLAASHRRNDPSNNGIKLLGFGWDGASP